jgi:hypothetical protein
MADNKMKIGAMSACRVVECQKLSFNASCPTRGLTEVLPMTPNVAELKLFVGIGKLWVVEEVERLSPKLHTGARSGPSQRDSLGNRTIWLFSHEPLNCARSWPTPKTFWEFV